MDTCWQLYTAAHHRRHATGSRRFRTPSLQLPQILQSGPLSGGQQQRAFGAMVLSQETDCVLLDEPLSSLDTEHAVAMMKRLRRIADELGKTIALVLHDINFASCCSDRIVVMKAGRVMNHGPPPELIISAVLHNVYELEVRVETIGEHPIGIYFT